MINFLGKHIHFVGIGGISMSALAQIVKSKGAIVSGSDLVKSRLTKKLESQNIKVFYEHNKENVKDADLVIYSPAIHFDNSEIVEAKKLGLIIMNRAELLSKISSDYENVITIAGSHGKTTTTAMVAWCFLTQGLNPTIHIGGEMVGGYHNAFIGGRDYFITEACEYVDSFLYFKNQTISCALNVQSDHMDYFKTIKNLQKSFKKYIKNTNKNGFCVINADDGFLNTLEIDTNKISYGIQNRNAIFTAKNIRECRYSMYSFDVFYKKTKLIRIKLSVVGKHQIYNALACYAICKCFNLDDNVIKQSLENFSGVKRRFEDVGYINGAKVFHDYAHHPTEIEANIKATKRFTKRKLYVVFQPHTFSRTKALWNQFKTCFSCADDVTIFKIYPAREEPICGITAETLSKDISKTKVTCCYCNDYDALLEKLKTRVNKDDIVLILGAGDIEKFCDYIKHE